MGLDRVRKEGVQFTQALVFSPPKAEKGAGSARAPDMSLSLGHT